MNVELRFRETGQKRAIAYLHPVGAPDENGHMVRNTDDYNLVVNEILNDNNRLRRIIITGTWGSARSLALAYRDEMRGEAIIRKLADDIYVVGLISNNGDYDNGIPWISDLRETGVRLKLDTEFPNYGFTTGPGNINIEVEDNPLVLVGEDPALEPDESPVESPGF